MEPTEIDSGKGDTILSGVFSQSPIRNFRQYLDEGAAKEYHVAIVGCGPNGLRVFERLAAFSATLARTSAVLHVHVIDPGKAGQGIHRDSLERYLLMNNRAGFLKLFTGENTSPVLARSLAQWAREEGYRRVNGLYRRLPQGSQEGDAIGDDDFLPRFLLGDYLSWVFDYVANHLPLGTRLHKHSCRVVNITRNGGGLFDRFDLILDNGHQIGADFVVLTPGHSHYLPDDDHFRFFANVDVGRNGNPNLGYYRFDADEYSLDALEAIAPSARVGIYGMRLTAYDAIAKLTEGRGGRFMRDQNGKLRYQRSGIEPQIVLFSPDGLPYRAARSTTGNIKKYQGQFLTQRWIEERLDARRSRPDGGVTLDFMVDVWPTLRKEMAYAAHLLNPEAAEGAAINPDDYLPSDAELQIAEQFLFPFGAKELGDHESFCAAARRYIENEVARANSAKRHDLLGVVNDLLSDMSDILEAPASIKRRLSFGTTVARSEELIALMDPDPPIVSFGPGPNPQISFDSKFATFVISSTELAQPEEIRIDVLVRARLDRIAFEEDLSLLIQNLRHQGLIKSARNGRGPDVTDSFGVIDEHGSANFGIYAIWPRWGLVAPSLQDVGHCALQIVERISQRDTLRLAMREPISRMLVDPFYGRMRAEWDKQAQEFIEKGDTASSDQREGYYQKALQILEPDWWNGRSNLWGDAGLRATVHLKLAKVYLERKEIVRANKHFKKASDLGGDVSEKAAKKRRRRAR